MSLFSGEKEVSPKIEKLSTPLKADASLSSYVFPVTDAWGGITLTAGDTPIMGIFDNSGVAHVIVLTSGAALAVRS